MMQTSPEELKARLGAGLLSFPVTHFLPDHSLDLRAYRDHVDWQIAQAPAAIFAAAGTGEFFSLALAEFTAVVAAAVETAAGRVPVLAGCGYGTALAREFAKAAEGAGADGILLLPPFLVAAAQDGLFHHVAAVCEEVSIGVIAYNRDNAVLSAETLERLAERCPNLIGVKDGHGDIEILGKICRRLGDRLVCVGGMPTAEIYAVPYKAMGVSTYSSAILNFLPDIALGFYDALCRDDQARMNQILSSFFDRYLDIRNRSKGYAVSIVKAGLRVVGRDAGPVRLPLTDLTTDEHAMLADLVEANASWPARALA